jgi:hypothetical protein
MKLIFGCIVQLCVVAVLLFPMAGFSSAENPSVEHKKNTSDWRLIGSNPEQQHFSTLNEINDESVKRYCQFNSPK